MQHGDANKIFKIPTTTRNKAQLKAQSIDCACQTTREPVCTPSLFLEAPGLRGRGSVLAGLESLRLSEVGCGGGLEDAAAAADCLC